MAYGLAQAHAAGVRADGLIELLCQQVFEHDFLRTGHSGGVDLHDAKGVGLQILLVQNTALHLLAGGYLDGIDGARDRGVADHIIRAGRLLHPCQIEVVELVDPVDGGGHIPHLVGVHSEAHIGANSLAGLGQTAQIVIDVLTDLELDLLESLDLGFLLGKGHHLLIRVAKPAGSGRIAGVADLKQVLDALSLALLPLFEYLDGFFRAQGVGHVTEIERRDQLLRIHLAQQQPQRLACALGLDIPQRGEHRTDGHMLNALFGAEPAQLGIMHEQVPCDAHVVEQFLRVTPDQHL